jgi:hypothetical protein
MDDPHRQVLYRLYLSSQREQQADGRLVLSACPQIQQIAQMIGCTREKVARRLSELERARCVKTRRMPNRRLIEVTVEKKGVNLYLADVVRT